MEKTIEISNTSTIFLGTAAVLCKLAAGIVFVALLVAAVFFVPGLLIKGLAIAWVALTSGFWMFRWEPIASARRNAEPQRT